MTKTRKLIGIITLAVMAILCFLSLSFAKNNVFASVSSSYFTIYDGIWLYSKEDSLKGRVAVSVTADMYAKLTEPTKEETFLWKTTKKANPYYLKLTAVTTDEKYYTVAEPDAALGEFSEIYHIDPENANIASSKLRYKIPTGLDEEYALLEFIIPADYTTEYRYYVTFGEYKEVQKSIYNPRYNRTDYYYVKELVWGEKTANFTKRSIKTVAERLLENETETLTSEQIKYFQRLACVSTSGEEFTVNVGYKKLYGAGDIRTETASYRINNDYATCSSLVFSQVRKLTGKTGIYDFNCIYENVYAMTDGTVFTTDARIILQAKDFGYSYDNSTHTGTLTIVYKDFLYKDLAIELKDNDISDTNNLTMYIFPINVAATSDNKICLTYDYASIVHNAFASVGWIFNLSAENFNVTGAGGDITVNVNSDNVQVVFPDTAENALMHVRITALAEIIPDYECTVNIRYAGLSVENGDIIEELRTKTETMFYSKYIVLDNSESFYNKYGNLIDSAVNAEEIKGLKHYEYSGTRCVDNKNNTFDIIVIYTYNTLLRIKNNVSGEVKFSGLTKNSLTYEFSEFGFAPQAGYRIKDLIAENNDVSIVFKDFYPQQSKVVINASVKEKNVITVNALLSDMWQVRINYLTRYKNSCFAELKTYNGEIRVSDYGDIQNLSGKDVEEIVGEKNVKEITFGKIPVRIESVTVTSDGDLFEFDLSYTDTFIKGIESDGTSDYFTIKLTRFSDWQEYFGKKWSILALSDVFTYSDEVAPDKLYAFFTVMTFKEKVSDFNSWFKKYTSNGCVTFFDSKEIKGSEFYKFMRNNPALLTIAGGVSGLLFGHPVAGAAAGTALTFSILSAAEAANDENGLYYSYFLYLDGTTDKTYSAHNGAGDFNDEDSASKNFVGDVAEKIKEKWNAIADSKFVKAVKISVAVILGLIVAGIIYRLIRWAFGKRRN